jgi:hypothetical protein
MDSITRLVAPGLQTLTVNTNIITVTLASTVAGVNYLAQLSVDGAPVGQPIPMSSTGATPPAIQAQFAVDDSIPGATFQVRIQAVEANHPSSAWATSTDSITRLATPALRTLSVSGGTITAILQNAVSNADAYQAQLVADGIPAGPSVPLTTTAGNPPITQTQFIIDDSLVGSTFRVQTRAMGSGHLSSIWAASVDSISRLVQPALQPLSVSVRTITITLQGVVPNAEAYQAQLVQDNNPVGQPIPMTTTAGTPPVVQAQFNVDNPVSGSTYKVRVQATSASYIPSTWITSTDGIREWPALPYHVSGHIAWNDSPVPGARAQLKSGDYASTPVLAEATVDASGQFTLESPPAGTYQLYAVAPSDEYWPWISHTITINSGVTIDAGTFNLLKKLQLLGPADGASIDASTQALTWTSIAAAARYDIDLSDNATGQPVLKNSTTGTNLVIGQALNPGSSYKWSVSAYNAAGNQIAYSSALSFTAQKIAPPKTSKSVNNLHNVQNQWGGAAAPWHDGGMWIIGARPGQNVIALNITSGDGGKTLNGTMTYAGEGPIGFQATQTLSNTYTVQNQWGGTSAPWHPGGTWIIGCRGGQGVVAVNVTSGDGGITLNGTMTYAGEGPIGFRSAPADGGVYTVQNQWGGAAAPWNQGGTWVIGCRAGQNVVAINVSSNDGGKTLNGTMTYQNEGPIGFTGLLFGSDNYTVQNQWGGASAPWNPGGVWVIGCRAGQNVVAINVTSSDGGNTLNGTMTYQNEGPIGFRGTLT